MGQFQKHGYKIVRSFIDPSLRNIIEDYTLYKSKTSGLRQNYEPDFIPHSLTFYGDNLTESLLKSFLPKMEEITELSLVPTYSFLRLYKGGDRLPKHKDRLSCQIAVSLCIAYSYDHNEYRWPFILEGKEIDLKPCDALIYRGSDIIHWRNKFERKEEEWHLQMFFFYIDTTAEFAKDLAFDARPELGLTKDSAKIDIREYEHEYFTSRGFVYAGRATYHD